MSDALDQARARFVSGNAHFEAGRLDEALADFDAALALAPGRPSLLANRGTTLCRLARWGEAVAALQAAVQPITPTPGPRWGCRSRRWGSGPLRPNRCNGLTPWA